MSPRVDRRTLLALVTLAVIGCACTGAGVDSVSGAATGTDPVDGDGGGDEDVDVDGDGDGGQPPPTSPETMVMIGDSITFMSIEPLQAELSDTGLEVLAIDAQVDRRITAGNGGQPYPGTDIVEFIANSDPPDLWVIALGTNDIGQYADAGEFGAQVQTLLDLLPAAAPLVWVDTWDGDRLDETRLVNDTLRAVVGRRDNAVVVDWFSHADDDGVVTDDEVHPTTDGILVFGQVVADGVDALLASL